jgi:agmatine deiminase
VSVLRGWEVEVCILGGGYAALDIWIRDWGFVEDVFFRYAPDYAEGLYSRSAVIRARQALVRRRGVHYRDIPVTLDGGNVIHNGSIAILTEKVLCDNAHLSRGEIESAIVSLGFERVVFIPVEPGDEIGHSDGMCRFASERVLLVNDYDTAAMFSFRRRLRRVLKNAKLNAELVPLPWFCRARRFDGVPSAEGCYMNFLRLAQGVIVPGFGNRKDDKAREVLAAVTEGPVETVAATPLAKLGGVFNCISLTF